MKHTGLAITVVGLAALTLSSCTQGSGRTLGANTKAQKAATERSGGSVRGAHRAADCSFTRHQLDVSTHDAWNPGGQQTQWVIPMPINVTGKDSCVVRGRATIELLDRAEQPIGYRIVPGAPGTTVTVSTESAAVIELRVTTGGSSLPAPAKVRITLPNGGGSTVIPWHSLRPSSQTPVTVDGFQPWTGG